MSIELKEFFKEKNIKTVEVIYADTIGAFGGKMIPVESFLKNYEEGFGVCQSSLGWDIQGNLIKELEICDFNNGCPDVYIKPSLLTLKEVPWRKGYAFVIGEIYHENGEPFKLAPRHILKNIIKRFNDLNYKPIVGTEIEFYLLDNEKNPLAGGIHCYSHRRAVEVENILGEVRDRLEKLGIKVEASHVEYGPGQVEIILEHGDALEIADNSLITKTIVKEVARNNNMYATFMAKPWQNESGSGFHIHQSIWNLDLTENIFQTDNEIADNYLSGVIETLSEFMAFIAPTINSYKRFTLDSFAPTVESWGTDNRTTAVRSLLSDSKGSRLEQRLGSSDAVPYLSIAASLAGGLYGIENKIPLKEKESENAYSNKENLLPKSLEEALNKLENSKAAKEYFGEEFVKLFLGIGRNELKLYSEAVTNWEFDRYLEYS